MRSSHRLSLAVAIVVGTTMAALPGTAGAIAVQPVGSLVGGSSAVLSHIACRPGFHVATIHGTVSGAINGPSTTQVLSYFAHPRQVSYGAGPNTILQTGKQLKGAIFTSTTVAGNTVRAYFLSVTAICGSMYVNGQGPFERDEVFGEGTYKLSSPAGAMPMSAEAYFDDEINGSLDPGDPDASFSIIRLH